MIFSYTAESYSDTVDINEGKSHPDTRERAPRRAWHNDEWVLAWGVLFLCLREHLQERTTLEKEPLYHYTPPFVGPDEEHGQMCTIVEM